MSVTWQPISLRPNSLGRVIRISSGQSSTWGNHRAEDDDYTLVGFNAWQMLPRGTINLSAPGTYRIRCSITLASDAPRTFVLMTEDDSPAENPEKIVARVDTTTDTVAFHHHLGSAQRLSVWTRGPTPTKLRKISLSSE